MQSRTPLNPGIRRTLLAGAGALIAVGIATSGAQAVTATPAAGTTAIVLLAPGTDAHAMAAGETQRNNTVTDVYSSAIDGFTALLDPADVARLSANPAVLAIETDAPISINAAPINDMFAGASTIAGTSGSVTGTTAGASREPGEPMPLGASVWGTSGKSIWYAWTAPVSGRVTFTTQGSGFDTLLAVSSGSSITGLTTLGANDDTASGTSWSTVSADVVAGTTYRVVIDGWGRRSGSTTLNWVVAAGAPANDAFANAAVITGSQGSQAGTTTNAAREANEPTHGGSGAHSTWYRWVAPGDGDVTFSTTGSAFATLLGAYTGASVASLSTVATGTAPAGQTTSSMTFAAAAGTAYMIAIDGAGGASGTTSLGWTFTATSPITAPGAPAWGLNPITVAGRDITAAVAAPSSDGGAPITAYTVTCSGTGSTRTGTGSSPNVAVTGLTAGATYTCVATARNASGVSAASGASPVFVMPTVPGAPTNVVATPADGSASIGWTAPSDGGSAITGYTVTASGGAGLTCTTTGTTTCSLSGLTNGVPYTFTVRGTNAVGTGVASGASAAVTPDATLGQTPGGGATPQPGGGATPQPAPAPDVLPPWQPGTASGPGKPQARDGVDWALDRLDQRSRALDGRYAVPLDGAGVTAYVIDTGVMATHDELAGRVVGGTETVGDGNGTGDCNGHGTHVAGTIAGTTLGMAPLARITPVRVLSCQGSGWVSDVIAGLDWIARTHVPGTPAVANLSMATPSSAALNAAVDRVIANGVTVAVAAGNGDIDACNMSPASDGQAIAVGATNEQDARAAFSDYGPCITLFAPGVNITSAWNTGPKATQLMSGTSMAAPHVTGAAALLLSGSPNATPAQVRQALIEGATTGVLSNVGPGSPNRLLYAGSASVPGPGSIRNAQRAGEATKPHRPHLRRVTRDRRGHLVLIGRAAAGNRIRIYAGKHLVKATTMPIIGPLFVITVTQPVPHGARVTVKAVNGRGASRLSNAISAP